MVLPWIVLMSRLARKEGIPINKELLSLTVCLKKPLFSAEALREKHRRKNTAVKEATKCFMKKFISFDSIISLSVSIVFL